MLMGMTSTNVKSETEQALAVLESSPHRFFLTGSRFFGYARDDSDYDFFTGISSLYWLREQFETFPIESGHYGKIPPRGSRRPTDDLIGEVEDMFYERDRNILFVFSSSTKRVQVQIVRDLQMKHTAQSVLTRFQYLHSPVMGVKKTQASHAWALAQSMYDETVQVLRTNPKK